MAENLFNIFSSEGDTFVRREEFERAVEAYSKALDIRSDSRNALLSRSRCYVRLGQYQLALQDAESCIGGDKTFHTGLCQKAEALYAAGDFEYALVFFHRAHRIRSDIMEYQLGIRKAESAINRAIGLGPESFSRPGTSATFSAAMPSPMERSLRSSGGVSIPATPTSAAGSGATTPLPRSASRSGGEGKVNRKLLGELYDDQEFLKKLLAEPGMQQNESMTKAISTGLDFIDSRTEFWRQQLSTPQASLSRTTPRSSRPGSTRPSTTNGRLFSGSPAKKRRASLGGTAKLPAASGSTRPRTTVPSARATRSTPTSARGQKSQSQRGSRRSSLTSVLGRITPIDENRADTGVIDRLPELSVNTASEATPSVTSSPANSKQVTPRRNSTLNSTEMEERRRSIRATHYVAKVMSNIEEALKTGAPDLALQFGKSLLSRLSTLEVPDHGKVTADAHSVMGTIYMALDRPTPAVIHHKKDLDISLEHGNVGGHMRALRQLANAYIRLDDIDMAVAVSTKLIDGELNPPSYILGEAMLQRGRAKYELKRFLEGAQDAEKAFEILIQPAEPREPGTEGVDTVLFGFDGNLASTRPELLLDGLCLHGRCLMALGKDAEAIERLQLCVQMAKENDDKTAQAAALTNLSVIELSQGRTEQGKKLQQEAMLVSQGRD
ncbi:TPR repeat [Carpediemonas membranifera]|uniref:Outer dynein arm-docking complex subunit 4 n=1 Tax=Carpediemonas membranifera TaxID=201153 RepID=A0A8J6BHE9_9EUKA|nr:TPR repeat [Carpediemonas membranifera]|eukprot:KAG9397527.1 TPR repeat [Carpediemonas membranifera]